MRCLICKSQARSSAHERPYDPLEVGELSVIRRPFACDRCGAVVLAAERWHVLSRFALDPAGQPLLHQSKSDR